MASSWSCPQARQWERMNGEPSARTRLMPESRGQLSGPVSLAREPPPLGAWLGLELVSWAFSSPSSRVAIIWAASQAGETWGLICSPFLLPCPSLSSGMDAQPALVIVCCGACLQPLFSPAPPLACKVYFLIAAPTTHLGSERSPSSSSLPPHQGWD